MPGLKIKDGLGSEKQHCVKYISAQVNLRQDSYSAHNPAESFALRNREIPCAVL